MCCKLFSCVRFSTQHRDRRKSIETPASGITVSDGCTRRKGLSMKHMREAVQWCALRGFVYIKVVETRLVIGTAPPRLLVQCTYKSFALPLARLVLADKAEDGGQRLKE
jgi:hypothetical protein